MEKYQFVAKLAEGAYGTVWKATDKTNGRCVAIKKAKEPPRDAEEAEFSMREVRLLQLVNHPNVVQLIEAFQSQSGRLYLVFEYMDSTLLALTRAHPGGLPQHAIQSVTWQLLQALACLHRNEIIHRDIKPSNILINGDGVVKLCDFGFARTSAGHNVSEFTTYVVTRWYRAPEILVGDPRYGAGVDVFALGCIVAEMATGRPLFPGKTHHDQLWLVLKCLGGMTDGQKALLQQDPQFQCFKLPSEAQMEPLESKLTKLRGPIMQLIKACLHPDAAQRPTAEQLLRYPFFKGVDLTLPPALRAQYKPEAFITDPPVPRIIPPRPESSTRPAPPSGDGLLSSPASTGTAGDLELSPSSHHGNGNGSQPSSSTSLASLSAGVSASGGSVVAAGRPPLPPTTAAHLASPPARAGVRAAPTSLVVAASGGSYRSTGASLIDDFIDNNPAVGARDRTDRSMAASLGPISGSVQEEPSNAESLFSRNSVEALSSTYGSPARPPMAVNPGHRRLSETGAMGDSSNGAGPASSTTLTAPAAAQSGSKRATWHGGSLGLGLAPRFSGGAGGHAAANNLGHSATHTAHDGPPPRRSGSGTGPLLPSVPSEGALRQRLSGGSAGTLVGMRASSTGSDGAAGLMMSEDGIIMLARPSSREHLGASAARPNSKEHFGRGPSSSTFSDRSSDLPQERTSGGQEGTGQPTGRLSGLAAGVGTGRSAQHANGGVQEGGGGSKGVAVAALDKAWQRLQKAANMIHGSEGNSGEGPDNGRTAARAAPPKRPSADGTGNPGGGPTSAREMGASGSVGAGSAFTARFNNRTAYSSDGRDEVPGLSAYFASTYRTSQNGAAPAGAARAGKALLPSLGAGAAAAAATAREGRSDSRTEMASRLTPRSSSSGTAATIPSGPPVAYLIGGGSNDGSYAARHVSAMEKAAAAAAAVATHSHSVGAAAMLPSIRSHKPAAASSVGRLDAAGRLGALHVSGVPAVRTVR